MYITSLSREKFVGWLGGREQPEVRALKLESSLSSIVRSEINLLWENDPNQGEPGRPLVVVDARHITEFFAFATTYVASFTPFSAFFRVVPFQMLPDLLSRKERLAKDRNLQIPLIGVVISEAFSLTRNETRSVAQLSVQSCLGTMASSMVGYIAKYRDANLVEAIAERWQQARRVFSSEPTRINPVALQEFWRVIASAFTSGEDRYSMGKRFGQLSALTEQLLRTRRIDDAIWAEATAEFSDLRPALDVMRGPREERIRQLDKYMSMIASRSDADLPMSDFLAGSLMASVADGSFDYLPLSRTVQDVFPKAPLWFGLLLALHPDSDYLVTAGCLGRHVAREIEVRENLFAPPSADISLDELLTLTGGEFSNGQFRTAHQSVVSVELLPEVIARYSPSRGLRQGQEVGGRALGPEVIRELRYHLDKAEQVLNRAEEETEPDLFRHRKRPRSQSRRS